MFKIIKAIYHNLERDRAKRKLAHYPNLTVIGITGSYGKTNTTVAVTEMLALKYKTLATDINLDTIYNVPKTVLQLKDHEKLVLELGVDHKGEMWKHLEIAKPQIAVLTGIAPVHADSEHLGSLEGIVEEKGHLLEVLPPDGWAIMNWDDPNVRNMINKTKAGVIRYGLDKSHCNLWVENIKVGFEGTKFNLHVQGLDLDLAESETEISTPLLGRQHAYTILAAAAVALTQGLTLAEIAKGAEKLEPLEGRLNIEKGPMGTVLINDSRRANVTSTIAGLQTLADLPGKRKIAILGQMGEMGKYEELGHRQVGVKVAEVKPDYTICVGEATKYIKAEAVKEMPDERVLYCEDVFAAAVVLKGILQPGDLVYLKGSLLKHLERIILLLEGKHVDPDSIASHRYQVYR